LHLHLLLSLEARLGGLSSGSPILPIYCLFL
jgi:hypothetical protein